MGLAAVGVPSWEDDGGLDRRVCRCSCMLERLEI